MRLKNKKNAIWIITIAVLLLATNTLLNIIVQNKIRKAIENFPSHINITYKDLVVSVLSGNVTFESPEFKIKGLTTHKTIIEVQVNRLSIKNLSLWNYLVNSKMSVNSITIEQPIIRYSHDENRKTGSAELSPLSDFKVAILFDKFLVTDADILITNTQTDSVVLSCPDINFQITKAEFKPSKTVDESSFDFEGLQLNAKQLDYNLSDYETFKIDSIAVSDDFAKLNGVSLKAKYSKLKQSQLIEVERDHFNLEIEEITYNDLKFEFSPQFSFRSSLVTLTKPEAEIYRDKRVADDQTDKPLYSKSLRNLGFDLGIDKLEIEDGTLIYEEQLHSGNKFGTLRFSELQVEIKNFGNQYAKTQATEIEIKTNFMENTPLKVDWNFVVQDSTDQFSFEAQLGYFKAESINPFAVPNLSARFEGKLNETYFTISGGPYVSNMDLKMKYEAFKVSLLNQDREEKNKFLSGLINIFIKKDSDTGEQGYRYGYADKVERDRTKSVFNFIWLNIQEALLKAITNGDKKRN